jgi:uncharacterized damage-inducible protein DinB
MTDERTREPAPSEIERMSALLRQAWRGEPGKRDGWHGPSLDALLDGLDAEQAAARPIAGAHSIWELVLHLAVWDEIAARRLEGETTDMTTGSPGDWVETGATTPEAWRAALARLRRAQDALLAAVERLPPAALDQLSPGRAWTQYTQAHGTLHHDLYHAGQIALLRRALEGSS